MSDIISFEQDIKPLRRSFFGVGGMDPEDMERFTDAYRRDLNPLLEANIKHREDRRKRKREDFIFKQQKNKFRQEKQNQKLIRQARQDDPTLSQELANITEMDDPKAAMAELVSWTTLNSKALRENPSLSNTQVMVSNILKSKAEEESSNEKLLAMQIQSFIAAGDFETAASMAQGVKNPTLLDTLNRNIGVARNAKTSAEVTADTKQTEYQREREKEERAKQEALMERMRKGWEDVSKSFERPEDFKAFDPETNKQIKFNELNPLKKLDAQGKPTWAAITVIEAAMNADKMLFADFQNEDLEDILDDKDKGNQLLKLVNEYYRLGGDGSSRGAAPTVNAGE